MGGRLVGSAELDLASNWIRDRFAGLGLVPAGDNGTYDQRFDLVWFSEASGNRLTISGAGGARLAGNGWTPMNVSATGSASGDVVFAGFGIVEPRLDYDDYQGGNVRGKVVLVREREPGVADGAGHEEPAPRGDDPPQAEEAADKPPEEAGAVVGRPQAKPGVVGTGMLGVVSTPGAAPISEVADAAAMPASEEEKAAGPEAPDPSPGGSVLSRLRALPRVVLSRLGPVNDLMCEDGSRLLELMDWPLQRTGLLVRRLVGLVALATMAIAIIVLVFSLF